MVVIGENLLGNMVNLPSQELAGFLNKGKHFATLCLKKSCESTALGITMFVASGCGVFVGFFTFSHLVFPSKKRFDKYLEKGLNKSITASGICLSATAGLLTVAGAHTAYRRYVNPSLSTATSVIITLVAMFGAVAGAISLED